MCAHEYCVCVRVRARSCVTACEKSEYLPLTSGAGVRVVISGVTVQFVEMGSTSGARKQDRIRGEIRTVSQRQRFDCPLTILLSNL